MIHGFAYFAWPTVSPLCCVFCRTLRAVWIHKIGSSSCRVDPRQISIRFQSEYFRDRFFLNDLNIFK